VLVHPHLNVQEFFGIKHPWMRGEHGNIMKVERRSFLQTCGICLIAPVSKLPPPEDDSELKPGLQTISIDKIVYESIRSCQYGSKELKDNMESVGQQNPILCRAQGPNAVLIDGLARVHVAKLLGWKTIVIHIVKLDDTESIVLIPSQPRIETKPEEYKKHLVKILSRNPQMTIDELAHKICRSPAWVNEVLK